MSNVTTIPVQQTQVVDTRYTQDVIPVLDTSKFEHMQRIACVMARTSMLPVSLRCKDGDENEPLDEDVVIANCFRVVNQAVRWGMDPFAVVDCASIIHGRLMWEGKLVAAVIDAKLGIKLNYKYDDKPGQELGVTVFATLPGEKEPREIFGRVKDWHKGPKSPWASEGAWKRQLRYMGNREWARAHSPATMLGVYTDDELDVAFARDVPAGQRALRMMDVPPASKPLEIPDDIPDEAISAPAEVADPISDVDGFLSKLKEEIGFCASEAELTEVREANADLIKRLPVPAQRKAVAMLSEAAE